MNKKTIRVVLGICLLLFGFSTLSSCVKKEKKESLEFPINGKLMKPPQRYEVNRNK